MCLLCLKMIKLQSEVCRMLLNLSVLLPQMWWEVRLRSLNLFLLHQEALVRFAGFGPEEDEWVNVRKHVRQQSVPCESSECVAILPGDLALCFQIPRLLFNP